MGNLTSSLCSRAAHSVHAARAHVACQHRLRHVSVMRDARVRRAWVPHPPPARDRRVGAGNEAAALCFHRFIACRVSRGFIQFFLGALLSNCVLSNIESTQKASETQKRMPLPIWMRAHPPLQLARARSRACPLSHPIPAPPDRPRSMAARVASCSIVASSRSQPTVHRRARLARGGPWRIAIAPLGAEPTGATRLS